MSGDSAGRHLISLQDLGDDELRTLLEGSLRAKAEATRGGLEGRTAGMLFFRGSLRTRTSFEAAVHQLGGHGLNLNAATDFWELEARSGSVMDGRAPEHIRDAAEVLSRYLDVLAIRPALEGQSWETDRRDASIRAWAEHARVPVINMESALWHPLQALADMMTVYETLGEFRGRRLAIVWTHSPTPASSAVVHSLLTSAVRLGMEVRIAHPRGYDLDGEVLGCARDMAERSGAAIEIGTSREEAAAGAHVIYARSWQSLEDHGNPTLAASRRARTGEWIVDEALLARGDEARLMHAGPVRRNLEATDEVLDGPRSMIYEQAENRLHSQKALLASLLGN
ncbi:MAG: acetylornithine carbamoyltransferase [Planctomycetes bacterium]|nr:acetylornithine carbamoyltransferase [Planctomycetota bacterium]MDP6408636.1 N-acetylornithine carbamoyltransferase [Planctomycetota bacterium]